MQLWYKFDNAAAPTLLTAQFTGSVGAVGQTAETNYPWVAFGVTNSEAASGLAVMIKSDIVMCSKATCEDYYIDGASACTDIEAPLNGTRTTTADRKGVCKDATTANAAWALDATATEKEIVTTTGANTVFDYTFTRKLPGLTAGDEEDIAINPATEMKFLYAIGEAKTVAAAPAVPADDTTDPATEAVPANPGGMGE